MRANRWTGPIRATGVGLCATAPFSALADDHEPTVSAAMTVGLAAVILFTGIIIGAMIARWLGLHLRKSALKSAADSEDKLKLALWGSGDEVWLLDLQSGEIARTVGVEDDSRPVIESVTTFDNTVHPDDLPAARQAMTDHLTGRAPWYEAMYRVQTRDHRWLWVLTKGRIAKWDQQGRATMVAGVSKDISELKRSEQVLLELNENLETMVEARTSDLQSANESLKETLQKLRDTQHQLVESEKMASLGGLVAGVAHEINTPLGVAVTATSHLQAALQKQAEALAGDQKALRDELCGHVRSAAFVAQNLKRAADLVRGFKQVAVDQSMEDIRRFDVREYLHEILLSLRPRLKRLDHAISIDCPERLYLESYPGAIYQILTNLIMNSLIHGFTRDHQGSIDIRVRPHSDDVELIYSDNGVGFGEDVARKIFDPFFTTSRHQGGSGLGMHIVYNLVTQVLEGSIFVEGSEGQGMSVNIRFPMHARIAHQSAAS